LTTTERSGRSSGERSIEERDDSGQCERVTTRPSHTTTAGEETVHSVHNTCSNNDTTRDVHTTFEKKDKTTELHTMKNKEQRSVNMVTIDRGEGQRGSAGELDTLDGEARQSSNAEVSNDAVDTLTMQTLVSCLTLITESESLVDDDVLSCAEVLRSLAASMPTAQESHWFSTLLETPTGLEHSSDGDFDDEDLLRDECAGAQPLNEAVNVSHMTTRQDTTLQPRRNVYVDGKFKDGDLVATLPLLVDSGAEISMIAEAVVKRLRGNHLRALRVGDTSVIRLAAGAETVPATAVATLWICFGRRKFKHDFLVADIHSSAILGSDFQGTHGSTMCYRTMKFHPDGDASQSVVMREASMCSTIRASEIEELREVEQVSTAVVKAATAGAERRVRRFHLEEETVLPPYSQTVVEGVVMPPYSGDAVVDVIIADDNEVAVKGTIAVADTLTTMTAGATVFTRVCNLTASPVVIPEGAKIADITPLHDAEISDAVGSVSEAAAVWNVATAETTSSAMGSETLVLAEQ
jgi:hypothetical protein